MALKWELLADDLARACADLPAGAVLPSTKQLIAAGRGSRTTVGEAFNELTRRGLVKGKPGKGYVVLPRRRSKISLIRQGSSELGPFGLDGDGRLVFIRQTFGEPLANVAMKLALPEDALQVVERLHHVVRTEDGIEDQVILIQNSWYPSALAGAAGLDKENSSPEDVVSALMAAGLVGSASEHVRFRPPTDAEARALGLSPAQAVVQIERILVDQAGRPVELIRLVAPAERTDLTYANLSVFATPGSG
ncbi:GntR family transcriptional regulator [Kitasatospora sp. GP82]|uniref:GntR family transcriptional regulator n=1 Tax=Kitasatospora sp. GP82 TaxID=3035089 RepID=UPI0024736941|nr:GntR family transcriptional regulator [Kitasatospora sp. GP82]MDH6129370.1 GntR family transcriptional regulator [Kitasatospora sp. GP82]